MSLRETRDVLLVAGIVGFFSLLAWLGVFCVQLLLRQLWQVSRNYTTNESINWKHYPYMQDQVEVAECCDDVEWTLSKPV